MALPVIRTMVVVPARVRILEQTQRSALGRVRLRAQRRAQLRAQVQAPRWVLLRAQVQVQALSQAWTRR